MQIMLSKLKMFYLTKKKTKDVLKDGSPTVLLHTVWIINVVFLSNTVYSVYDMSVAID